MNIVLSGLPGSGKTTLGKTLAAELDMRFFDMDDSVEQKVGMPIREIFAQYGEEHFRGLELQAARAAARLTNALISAGGGAVTKEETIAQLKSAGLVVFVDRPPERIVGDISTENRPLLSGGAERIYKLSAERRELYLSCADAVFLNTEPLSKACASLCDLVRGLRGGYAVIGDPIAHSLSPAIHGAVFQAENIDAAYTAVHVPRGELEAFVRRARLRELRGFNITAPHKRDVIPLLDEIDSEARLCGAVNTVVARSGRLCGYNTDMEGLLGAVRDHGREYKKANIVVLGTGGAAAGIVLKALREKAKTVTLMGRRPEAAREITALLEEHAVASSLHTGGFEEQELRAAMRDCDLLISALPSGVEMDLSFLRALPPTALVYDISYSPPQTPVMKAAAALGLKNANGLGMLIHQAVLADEHYLGRPLDRKRMYSLVLEKLERQGLV